MNQLRKVLAVAGCAAALGLGANNVAAQGRGNFDPAQMRQRMMDRAKETLEVTDDSEWKVLEAAIGKVMDAQQELRSAGGGMFGRGGPRRNNNNNPDANANANGSGDQAAQGGQNGGRRRGGFGGPPSPEVEALQKAIDDKASPDDIKSKLAKVRETAKAKEAKLVAAQADLQKLLSARQEASAVLLGLLK
jgi:hypothetical protein